MDRGLEQERAGAIGRRGLLRAGAVLAGAAAATAAGAVAAEPAQAADGDAVKAGQDTAATSTTSLTVGGSAGITSAALALNNANGPGLALAPLPADWAGTLAIGDVAGSSLGPIVGVDSIDGPTTTYLATGMDLANIPTPFPTTPSRVLDLRYSTGRASILRKSSADALDSDGRLRAGQWIDIALIPTGDDYVLGAVFANLTVTQSLRAGYGVLAAPGVRPATSTINYVVGQTIANGAFVATGAVLGYHTVRLWTSADAFFVLDITGGVTSGTTQAPLSQSAAERRSGGRTALIQRLRTALARASR